MRSRTPDDLPPSSVPLVLVDDAHEFRALLGALVARRNALALVGEGATGAEALELTRTLRPAALVIDRHLPDGDSLDMLPALRELAPEACIFVCSSRAPTTTVLRRAIAAGADTYTSKADDLSLVLQNLLRCACAKRE